jgi:hypothetical protein
MAVAEQSMSKQALLRTVVEFARRLNRKLN